MNQVNKLGVVFESSKVILTSLPVRSLNACAAITKFVVYVFASYLFELYSLRLQET